MGVLGLFDVPVRVIKPKNSPIKTMQGCNLTARLKTAAASFCVSPYHLSVSSDTSRLMKLICASLAVAFAIRVLPHPGNE